MKQDYQREYLKNKSFWELSEESSQFDFIVIGAGFTGLYTALEIRKRDPAASIAILERANRYGGASTRNAGFVCFGSPSEIMTDVETTGRQSTIELLRLRYEGMRRLRHLIPGEKVDMKWSGGSEVFQEGPSGFESVDLQDVNAIIEEATGLPGAYQKYPASQFGIHQDGQVLYTEYEGAMNPQKAVNFLADQCLQEGISIIRGCEVNRIQKPEHHVLETNLGTFQAKKIAVCTNAYTSDFLKDVDVRPAKNQVYVTCPVKHNLVGTYHMNAGYIYFRGMGDRILIGGARHLEQNDDDPLKYNAEIESYLESILKRYVCPGQNFSFDYRWMGHIGIGQEKGPLIKTLDGSLVCGVRLSGMGVALAPELAEQIVDRMYNSKDNT